MPQLTDNLIQLIPPALILSGAAYLVVFFGKIINDQRPYADSRKWDTELSGLNFSLELFWVGLLAYALAVKLNFWLPNHFWDLVAVAIVGALLFIANRYKGEEIYQVKFPSITPFEDKDVSWLLESFARVFNLYIPWWPFALISLYVLIGVFHQGNLWWFSAIAVQIFINFIFFALNYSFRRTKLPTVDIYFTDGKKKPLLRVMLIKVSEDTVRVRSGEKIILVNKNQVLKIEIPLDKKVLPVAL